MPRSCRYRISHSPGGEEGPTAAPTSLSLLPPPSSATAGDWEVPRVRATHLPCVSDPSKGLPAAPGRAHLPHCGRESTAPFQKLPSGEVHNPSCDFPFRSSWTFSGPNRISAVMGCPASALSRTRATCHAWPVRTCSVAATEKLILFFVFCFLLIHLNSWLLY